MAQNIEDKFKDVRTRKNKEIARSSSGAPARSGSPGGRNSGSGRSASGSRNSSAGRQSSSRRSEGQSSGRQASGRNSSPSGGYRESDYEEDTSGAVLIIVITVGVAIFLTLCCMGMCGKLGEFISGLLFGAFGFPAYITPAFIAFLIIWYLYAADEDEALPIRFTGCILLYLVVGMISDMISGATFQIDEYNAGDIYKICSDGKCGGGVISGSLSFALNKGIGSVGEVLICILVFILSLFAINRVFFTRLFKNIFSGISDRSGELVRTGMEKAERRRQKTIEADNLPELPYDGDDYYPDDSDEPADYAEDGEVPELPAAIADRLSADATEKRQEKSDASRVLTNFINGRNRRAEENKAKREAEKKIREETDDAKDILDVKKVPSEKNKFEKIHTGEMHEMNYRDDEADFEPYEEDYEPFAAELPKHVIPVKSDHSIVSADTSDDSEDDLEVYHSEKDDVKAPETVHDKKPQVPVSSSAKQSSAPKKAGRFTYKPPTLDYLKKGSAGAKNGEKEIKSVQNKLVETLASFGIEAEMGAYSQGPTVTRYEFTVSQGTKLSRIVNLSDEIKMALAATDIRIEAPIPGKSAIGIEVPNASAVPVFLGDLLSSTEFKKSDAVLSFAVGKDIEGKTIVSDIRKFPHILIAGTTGSGKSVCVNTLVLSLLYKSSPEDVQLILVDPKVVELKVYNGIPHLPFNVITKPKAASEMLKWAVQEMERRYRLFADRGVRDIDGYNQYVIDVNAGRRDPEPVDIHEESESLQPVLRKLPAVVIIIDELADLMMVAAKEVEESICRLAQLARAAGMHLVVATQRPSVDVITGLIKANMPSRLAFAVSSGVDSRTILDQVGAEKLLGKGDMLFYPQGKMKPDRLQGAFVSDEEVAKVTGYLRGISQDPSFRNPLADVDGIENLKKTIKDIEAGIDVAPSASSSSGASAGGGVFGDDLFEEAGLYIIRSGKASIGYLQRVLKIGFNRAARIMDELADNGVVGQEQGTKPRDILMTEEMFTAYIAQKTSSEE